MLKHIFLFFFYFLNFNLKQSNTNRGTLDNSNNIIEWYFKNIVIPYGVMNFI